MKIVREFILSSSKLSLEGAKALVRLAEACALKRNVPGAVAVVDDGGNLILAERWDNTMIAAIQIAIDKAITSVSFQRPTIALENVVNNGRLTMLNPSRNIHYAPLKGGYPIFLNGNLVGAIAISGTLDANIDEEIVLEVLESYQKLDNSDFSPTQTQ